MMGTQFDDQAQVHLKVVGLTKTFTLHMLRGKRVPACRDVSFDVPRGRATAIVGSSGSGKSSLLKCIFRTYLPTAGQVLLLTGSGARNLAEADDHEILALRRREIGYVAQFLHAPPRVSALDVVARPRIEQGVPLKAARDEAAHLLEQLTLPHDLFEAYPSLFSGGEQQRVNIARALITRSKLLLLDEPTSALDRGNLDRVVDLLRQAQAEGTTILAVLHDRAVVEALADEVVVMEQGAVRHIGPWSTVPAEYRDAGAGVA